MRIKLHTCTGFPRRCAEFTYMGLQIISDNGMNVEISKMILMAKRNYYGLK